MLSWASRRFSRKISAAFILILLAATSSFDFLFSRSLRTQLVSDLTASLLTQARLLSLGFREGPSAALAEQAGRECDCRVSFIEAGGKVLADSAVPSRDLPNVENHRERPEVRAALAGGEGSAVRRSATIHQDLLYAAVPYRVSGRIAGVVRLALSLDLVEARIARQRKALLGLSSALLAAAVLAALWLSGSISRPVDEMSRVADSLARGDYQARIRFLPRDELGRLGSTLNLLAERVSSTIAELSKEKTQLSAVLSDMVEGVIAVDAEGRVLLVNSALSELLGLDADAARGKPFVEVLRQGQIGQFLEGVLRDGAVKEGEARLFTPEERVFEVHALPMVEAGRRAGALAVLHDITRIRRLEQVRRDFVANVSHELRTPLVSIKGFAETLQSGAINDKKNRAEFLETIQAEADRMSQLVDDLLQLSAIESGQRRPALKELDPLELAREVAESLRPLAERRGVKITVIAERCAAKADPAQLRQVLVNLLSNAIKFNKESGSVTVSADREGAFVSLRVADTGIGIPREDLPRIFERFYRVDKARSRELGGTGLGLAIVKHIVEAHGGSVSVQSVEDQGSTFQFTLPA